MGIFQLASASFDDNADNGTIGAGPATKFGGMIRAGFEVSHFRLGIEYNLIGNSSDLSGSKKVARKAAFFIVIRCLLRFYHRTYIYRCLRHFDLQ